MATDSILRSSGVRVTLPGGIIVVPEEPAARVRRRPGRAPSVVPMPQAARPVGDEAAALAAALEAQDFTRVDRLELGPSPPGPTGVRTESVGSAEVAVDVDLDQTEGAVLLVEQDGVYEWHFDAVETVPPAPAPAARTRAGITGGRRLTFRLPLGQTPLDEKRRRGRIHDLIIGRAQVFVFKYAGRFLLRRGSVYLERNVRSGIVVINGLDPTAWPTVADLSKVKLPTDRRPRILLLVHGTFSSTRGGFSGLCATPWGQAFLQSALASYDAVIGFDHPTVSVDPLVNATELLRCFEAKSWGKGITVDAVCHSRGGLVLRSLVERLLPATQIGVQFDRVAFVGVVNGGTKLADPENWRSFINLYTNIATAACRAIAKFPQATFAATLTAEVIKGLGVLVRVLAEQATTADVLPGLAAMRPTGEFVVDLNKLQPGQPSAADSRYYAVTSDFRASLGVDSLEELPRQLLLDLAEGAVEQLMKATNDLVVDTESMTHIDPDAGTFIKDTLAFGPNGIVYHTNYFLQPKVATALARWFDLKAADVPTVTAMRGVSEIGARRPVEVPAQAYTNFLLINGADRGFQIEERLKQRKPDYVVVERWDSGNELHYALSPQRVLDAIADAGDDTLENALRLHETDASPTWNPDVDLMPQLRANAPAESARRVVAFDDRKVIGVVEGGVLPTPDTELVQFAKDVFPKTQKLTISDTFEFDQAAVEDAEAAESEQAAFGFNDWVDEEEGPGGTGSGAAPPKRRTPPVGGDTGGPTPPVDAWPGPPEKTPKPPAAPTTVTCRFLAEMDDTVVVNETVSVDVTLSREIIQPTRAKTAGAKAEADTQRRLTVELIPKKNFVPAGDTRDGVKVPRVDVKVPSPKTPQQLTFDVTATDVGPGEIVIRIRQQMDTLANLSLNCQIVPQPTQQPRVRRSQIALVPETPLGPQPQHQLTILETEHGGQLNYLFILDSPTLNLRNTYESKPLKNSREEYVKGIYEDIETRYVDCQQDSTQFQQELREVGAGLWDELIPDKLKADLWKARSNIQSIQVYSEEPFIPWELVHLKDPQQQGLPTATCFFGQMGLVRWLHNYGLPAVELRARPGRCFYLIPKYPHRDYELLEAQKEIPFLEKAFQCQPIVPHLGPLHEALEKRGGFDLFHFAGHGAAENRDIARAEILLAGRVVGENYLTERFRASAVEQLPRLVGDDGVRPVVTLNACQVGRAGYKLTSIGGFARAFLSKGAGLFISSMWSVGDGTARTFTETLYRGLLDGKKLSEATIAAREASRKAGEATWLAYTVYGHPDATLAR